MDTNLTANVRTGTFGKGSARKLRAEGKLPAVVYSKGGAATSVAIDPLALNNLFRHTQNRNTIVNLEIDGASVPCLVREAQRHPLSREILHVDFYSLAEDQVVTVTVPVEPVGRPAGASLGGRLRISHRTLTVRCKYADIPRTVPVNVEPLVIGDIVKVADVIAPANTELIFDSNFNVLNLYGKKGSVVETAE